MSFYIAKWIFTSQIFSRIFVLDILLGLSDLNINQKWSVPFRNSHSHGEDL